MTAAKTLAGVGRRKPTPSALQREIRSLKKELAAVHLEHTRTALQLADAKADAVAATEDAQKWRERAELQTEQITFWLDRLTIALTDWQKKGPKT